jgi:hypothetical protein
VARKERVMNKTDKKLVYYGPHPCQKCDPTGKLGTLIVKAGNGAPDNLEFDFAHDSHYPNHIWKKHKCTYRVIPE